MSWGAEVTAGEGGASTVASAPAQVRAMTSSSAAVPKGSDKRIRPIQYYIHIE